MLTILQGDDTAALGKTIRLGLPAADLGDGATVGFSFQDVAKTADYAPGGFLSFDYAAAETDGFPLGVSYGTLYIVKDGLRLTLSNRVAVKVTDCTEEVYGASNDIPVSLGIKSGYFAAVLAASEPAPEPLTIDSPDRARRALVNALRAALAAVPAGASVETTSALADATSTAPATVDTTDAQLRALTNALRRVINSDAFRLAAGTAPVAAPAVGASTTDLEWRSLVNEMLAVLSAAPEPATAAG
jgi:hypothetical protein